MGTRADFLVLGSGIAGLRAALGLARHGEVLVVTKDQPTESNTGYAQGGVAVAMAEDDQVALHLDDTLKAGAGLVAESAARVLVISRVLGAPLSVVNWSDVRSEK